MSESSYHDRFAGVERLYGEAGNQRVRDSHVMVIGLGGVGSWTVESLARSGVGEITLVDLDDLCMSNINRQIHATESNVGKQKGAALKERIQLFHPSCVVNVVEDFLTDESVTEILSSQPSLVVDAIDSVKNKALLIAHCLKQNIPIVTSGGAGGCRRPDLLKVSQLNRTHDDRLLRNVRKELRRKHGLPNPEQRKVPVVYSTEIINAPEVCEVGDETAELDGGFASGIPASKSRKLDCESGFGTVMHVTASMGLFLAHVALERISTNKPVVS